MEEPCKGKEKEWARIVAQALVDEDFRSKPPEKVRSAFDQKARDLLPEFIDSHFRFYKKVTDDERLGKHFLDTLFTRYMDRSASSPPS